MATPTGHHHPRRPDTDRRTLTGAENRLRALQLRKAGLPYHAIGQQLGTTSQYAFKLVKAALANLRTRCADETEDLRQLELERLDTMLMGLWTPAARGDHAAIDRVLKIMERRARLLGLDAPAKIAPTSPDGEAPYDPMQAVQELDALLAVMATRHASPPDL